MSSTIIMKISISVYVDIVKPETPFYKNHPKVKYPKIQNDEILKSSTDNVMGCFNCPFKSCCQGIGDISENCHWILET